MRRLFTLAITIMAIITSLNVSADNYRRTWDFRKGWSETTIAKLNADADHWEVQGTGFQNKTSQSVGVPTVTVDGVAEEISELSGMTVGGLKTAKHVQIVTTYSTVKDVPCLWLNGKTSGTDYVEVTVPAGENVKFGYTGHGATGRGFKVTGGFADASGNTTFTCTADNLNQINEVELINSNTSDATLRLQTTGGGSHIYYVIIGDGDAPSSSKVAIVYSAQAGKTLDQLAVYSAINGTEGITVEGINVDEANPTADQLKAYNAIILDNSLPVDNDLIAALKPNIQWQPTLNLNAPLAAALGYGTLVKSETNNPLIDNIKKTWFASLIKNGQAVETTEGSGQYTYTVNEGTISGLNLADGSHKAETALASLATEQDGALIETGTFNYVHNLGYNEYAFYGTDGSALSEASVSVVKAMVDELVSSKSDVKQCNKPTIKGSYREQESTITLTDIVKGATIYYTTDGTEPTQASTVYTDPLVFTTEATVKAIAIADGYTLSEVNSFDVKLYHQAKAPVITVSGNEATEDATVTLSSEDGDNVDIYYNFTESSDVAKSTKYTAPLTIKHASTITVFAVGKEDAALVQSDLVTEKIKANMKNVRRDVAAHFTGSGWNTVTNLVLDGTPMTAWANTSNYYFSWGKTAQASYTQSEEPKVDEQGNPEVDSLGNFVYEKTPNKPSVTTCTADADWEIISTGQVMVFQSNTLGTSVGDYTGYNPAQAEDYNEELATGNAIQFGGVSSGDACTAMIASTKKYQAPFNVVTIIANANGDKTTGVGNTNAKAVVEVSADSVTWTAVGEQYTSSPIYRNYKKTEVAYNGTDEVYVRLRSVSGSGQNVHDIYVFNHGEKSIAEEQAYADGIENVNVDVNANKAKAVKVVNNGQIVIVTANGSYTVTGARIK